MTKTTEHCMPDVTPNKPCAFRNAKIYPTIDRCNLIKGITRQEYADYGFDYYRDIETERYKYTIPSVDDRIAPFAQKIIEKPFANRLSVDEVDLIIRDKFKFDRHSLFQLFNIADVNKKGFLTKEALLKVMYTICGNVNVDHFYQLLERYNLNIRSVISFQEIEKAFTEPPVGKFLAPVIFHGMGSARRVSAAYALHLLREAALDKDFDLKVILPQTCFEENGIVLMPQFREALTRIQIHLCDEDFTRLWIKLDKKGVGSMTLTELLILLNLQDSGRPMCGLRQPLVPIKRPKIERVVRTKPPLKYTNCYQLQNKDQLPEIRAGGISFPLVKPYSWKPKGCGGSDEFEFGKGTQFVRGLNLLKQDRPHFYSILDNLSYIFEEPYQEMKIVFRHYDQRNSGFVPADVGLNILSEFGFKLEYNNLKVFLSKNNLLDPNNGINYIKLVDQFQIKGPGTHVSRMISNIIKAQYQSTGLKSLKTMSVEEIEEELYKILHRDFIRFQSELQKASPDGQHICENELRLIVDGILGYSMSKCQWRDLQSHFFYRKSKCEVDEEENRNKLVDYLKFLETFNKPTDVCRYRRKEESEKFDRIKANSGQVYDPPRRSDVLCRLVADTLKFRFHAIDKQYKSFGTGVSGSFTRPILYDLLNEQKCKLTPEEMDVIWAVVEANPNYNTWNYRQILKHLMQNLYKRAEELTIEFRKKKLTAHEDSNIDVLKEFRRVHKGDKARKEAFDLHKIDMALSLKPYAVDTAKTKATLAKLAPQMKSIWKPFKKQLRKSDIMGKATLELFEMKDILNNNNFNLTADEINNLLYAFDFKRNGRFDYIAFLNEFANNAEIDNKPNLHFDRLRHHVLNQKNNESITINNLYKKMREWLIKEWKSLIRAFRKLDTKKTSRLDIDQLNNVLLKSGVKLSEDDLYHLFTGFDTNLDGKIDYVEFIEQLLDVLVPLP